MPLVAHASANSRYTRVGGILQRMMMAGPRRALAALLCLCLVAGSAHGRPVFLGVPHSSSSTTTTTTSTSTGTASRRLSGFPTCPEGCSDAGCVEDSTAGGLRCQACLGSLVVRSDGSCGCAPGSYASGVNTCSSCPRGAFCPGGSFSSANATDGAGLVPGKLDCPGNMTTLGSRSTSIQACVNLPGFSYALDATTGAPSVVQCPPDTFCRGFRKQRACVPCPSGFSTNGVVGATSPAACGVPAGYYVKAPGQAVPCPVGEWRAGFVLNASTAGSCIKCPFGITTAAEASTAAADCAVLQPGFYAAALEAASGAVTAAKACPQRFYCPGGKPLAAFDPAAPAAALSGAEPTIKACPSGSWTQEHGSTAPQECLTPPGHFTAGGTTQLCPDGSFRAEWLPPEQATECTPCGQGVYADRTDVVTVFDAVTYAATALAVTSSADDCYVLPGMGLYYRSSSGTFAARACNSNSYGLPNTTYGLEVAPCRECPSGMVARSDAAAWPNSARFFVRNADGTGGFTSPLACVTQAGYGYSARVGQPCAKGAYNAADTRSTCTECPIGLTTAGPGTGVTLADCKLAPGFGAHHGIVMRCPVGTFNAELRADTTSACTPCPAGTTTLADGADDASDCAVCLPGFGGPGCASRCGGRGDAASYGVAGRPAGSECAACAASKTGYAFGWAGGLDTFAPAPVARLGADSPADCLAEFSQTVDNAFFLPLNGDSAAAVATTANVASFAACAALCSADESCMLVSYDYRARSCGLRRVVEPENEGAPWVAFKAEPSGDAGASSQRRAAQRASSAAHGKALGSGWYTFWNDAAGAGIGLQSAAPGASHFTSTQECLSACDNDNKCAGVLLDMTVDAAARPATCKLIKGNTRVGVFVRSMTRADAGRLAAPAALLSGSPTNP